MSLSVTVVIPTHDRRADLEATLHELERLDPAPDEIIVWLDACRDDTAQMCGRFPKVSVVHGNTQACEGSIPTRDTAFRMAKGDLIVSLDDDSYPLQDDFIARVVSLAERHPEAGAFAFHEIRPDGPMPALSLTREPRRAWVPAYPNCAGMMRKSIYGEITRYPRFFSHAYAEPDFCLQAYGAGYGILYVPEIEIFHRFTHAKRDMKARHHRNARNEFWSVVMRCPFPHVLWVGAYRVARQLLAAASHGWSWLKEEPKWIGEALGRIGAPLAERRPVPWPVYWRWMRMARRPLAGDAAALERMFPTVRARLIGAAPPG